MEVSDSPLLGDDLLVPVELGHDPIGSVPYHKPLTFNKTSVSTSPSTRQAQDASLLDGDEWDIMSDDSVMDDAPPSEEKRRPSPLVVQVDAEIDSDDLLSDEFLDHEPIAASIPLFLATQPSSPQMVRNPKRSRDQYDPLPIYRPLGDLSDDLLDAMTPSVGPCLQNHQGVTDTPLFSASVLDSSGYEDPRGRALAKVSSSSVVTMRNKYLPRRSSTPAMGLKEVQRHSLGSTPIESARGPYAREDDLMQESASQSSYIDSRPSTGGIDLRALSNSRLRMKTQLSQKRPAANRRNSVDVETQSFVRLRYSDEDLYSSVLMTQPHDTQTYRGNTKPTQVIKVVVHPTKPTTSKNEQVMEPPHPKRPKSASLQQHSAMAGPPVKTGILRAEEIKLSRPTVPWDTSSTTILTGNEVVASEHHDDPMPNDVICEDIEVEAPEAMDHLDSPVIDFSEVPSVPRDLLTVSPAIHSYREVQNGIQSHPKSTDRYPPNGLQLERMGDSLSTPPVPRDSNVAFLPTPMIQSIALDRSSILNPFPQEAPIEDMIVSDSPVSDKEMVDEESIKSDQFDSSDESQGEEHTKKVDDDQGFEIESDSDENGLALALKTDNDIDDIDQLEFVGIDEVVEQQLALPRPVSAGGDVVVSRVDELIGSPVNDGRRYPRRRRIRTMRWWCSEKANYAIRSGETAPTMVSVSTVQLEGEGFWSMKARLMNGLPIHPPKAKRLALENGKKQQQSLPLPGDELLALPYSDAKNTDANFGPEEAVDLRLKIGRRHVQFPLRRSSHSIEWMVYGSYFICSVFHIAADSALYDGDLIGLSTTRVKLPPKTSIRDNNHDNIYNITLDKGNIRLVLPKVRDSRGEPKSCLISAGTTFVLRAHTPHEFHNDGDTEALLKLTITGLQNLKS